MKYELRHVKCVSFPISQKPGVPDGEQAPAGELGPEYADGHADDTCHFLERHGFTKDKESGEPAKNHFKA